MIKKICNQCGEEKPLSEFYKQRRWHSGKCKKCTLLDRKDYFSKNKKKIAKRRHNFWINNKRSNKQKEKLELQKLGMQRCSECGEIKPFDKFQFRKTENVYRGKCIKCVNQRGRKWYHNNRERLVEMDRKWRANNPDKVKERSLRYRQSETYFNYRKNPKVILNLRIGNSIRKSITGNKKGKHWEDLVGYTLDNLKEHLELQFIEGMNWEKFLNGEIHIDHIIPISAFNFDAVEHVDFKRCWALENLRPLRAKENLKKSNRIERDFQPSLKI